MRNLEAKEKLHIEQAEVRIQKFMREFERTLGKVYRKLLNDLKSGEPSASEVAKMLGSFNTQIDKLVIGPGFAKLDPIYAKELARVKEYYAEFGFKNVITDANLNLAESLINFDCDAIKSRVFANSDALKAAVMRSVTVGNYATFDDLVDNRVDLTASAVETELRTGVMTFHRVVSNNAAAEAGLTLFRYTGPDDKVTRPFCKYVIEELDRILTLEEIQALDTQEIPGVDGTGNGQDLPVFSCAGGYNCRHEWSAITEERAREEYGYEPQ